MRYVSYITLLVTLLLSFTSVSAQMTNNREGKIDRSYGSNGLAALPQPNGMPQASIVTPGGATIVGYRRPHQSIRSILIIKQTPNGSIDTSFGVQGIREIELPDSQVTGLVVTALAQQADGKLLVAGTKFQATGADAFVYRLLPNGDIDSTFGVDGQVVLDFKPPGAPGISEDWITKLLVNGDGKVTVTALAEHSESSVGTLYAALVRLNSNGAVDLSFGTNGFYRLDVGEAPSGFGSLNYEYSDAALQKDGKIVFGLTVSREITTSPGNYAKHAFIIRFLENGVPDNTFSDDGIYDLGSSIAFTALKILPDEKILALVWGGLYKIKSDGTRDLEFGYEGRSLLADVGSPNSLLLMPDSKILIGGIQYQFPSGKPIVRFTRVLPNGMTDFRFGLGGRSLIEMQQNFKLKAFSILDEKRVAATCLHNNVPCTTRVFVSRK